MDTETARRLLQVARCHADLFGREPDTRVAALILAPGSHQIISTGVNGMCRGVAERQERWTRPAKYRWVVHAELDAIASAARAGVRLDGSVCVVTLFPCADCCKALIQAGIRELVSPEPDVTHPRWGQDFEVAAQMLREAGVRVVTAVGVSGDTS